MTDGDSPSRRTPEFPGLGESHRLGDFDLLHEIGRGGMGVVYEAQQRSLHRRVALKILPVGLGLTAQAVQRFQREAQAAAQLHHTHIVPVYAVGEEQGCHYYAMELIEGQPLAAILRELRGEGSSPLLQAAVSRMAAPIAHASAAETATARGPDPGDAAPPPASGQAAATSHGPTSLSDASSGSRQRFDTAARLIADVADALHYAHGRGIVHRDVKPANLLLSGDGRLCVTDFGLARVSQEPGMTVSGSFLGTPAYMSPEQIAAGRVKVDHRTDVYSLGAVLYELLTLERPFPGEGREEVLAGIMTKEPRAPRRINPRVPVDLETICLKALEKDPDRRYATARDMAEDLRAHLNRGLIAARRAGPLRRATKWTRRHPVAATMAIGVIGVASLVYVFQARGARERALRGVAEARVLLGQGEYYKGLARVQEALDQKPRLIEARRTRAELLLQMGHYVQAANEAKAILEVSPDDWRAHAVLGAAARNGWLSGVDVDEQARAVERLAPESADAFFLRSAFADNATERLRLLDRALSLDPSHSLALIARTQVLGIDLKDFPAARATADRLVAARPRSAVGLRMVANVSYWEDELPDALEGIEKAMALDPDDPVNYAGRANVRVALGRHEQALTDLSRAIELDPEFIGALWQRSGLLMRAGRFNEAIRDAQRALDLNPENFGSYMQLLWILNAAGRTEEARRKFAPLEILADRYGIPAQRCKAWADIARDGYHHWLRDDDRALKAANRAVLAAPLNPYGYVTRIQILLDREGVPAAREDCARLAGIPLDGAQAYADRAESLRTWCMEPNLALADLNRAITLAPSWSEAYRRRAQLNRDEGRFDDAFSDLGHAIDRKRWNARAIYERGELLADMERYEEALRDFERAMALPHGRLVNGWTYAEVLVMLGRDQEALKILDQAIALSAFPAMDWSEEAGMLRRMGRVQDAITAADKALAIQPTLALAHEIRGALEVDAGGRCDIALTHLRKAAELEGDVSRGGSVAWFLGAHFARVCPQQFDADEAMRLAERAARSQPREAAFHGGIAFVAYRRGGLARAEKEAMEAARLVRAPRDDVPTTHFLLAMIRAKMGDRHGAREAYDRGLRRMERSYPRDPENMALRDEAGSLLAVRR